jgi:fibronectin type 3 domain-containing protein
LTISQVATVTASLNGVTRSASINLLAAAAQPRISLSWTPSTTPGVIGYNLYRGTTPGGPYPTRINAAPVQGTNHIDSTVQTGRTYYYVATALDAWGSESVFSNQAVATVP